MPRPIIALVSMLGLFVSSAPGFAQPVDSTTCALTGYESSVRPDPPGTPTEVTVGLILTDLGSISDVDQTITLDALLTLEWDDHRLDQSTGCQYDFSAIWAPDIQLLNSATIRSRQPPLAIVNPAGRVVSTVRYSATIASTANIAEFPFDERSILLQLGSLRYDIAELTFRVEDSWTGRRPDLTIPDWAIGEPSATVTQMTLPRVGRTASIFEFRIPASRLADYYIYKFVFPLCLIVMMSWAVFWVDARNLSPQLSLAGTSMLTIVAYQFTVNDLLPRVGYLTSMDQYVLSSSLLVFLALVEALITGRLASTGRATTAEKLDRISRWLFPATYLVVIAITLVF